MTFVSARTGESETVWPTVAMFASASDLISGDLPNGLYLHYYLTQSLILLTVFVGSYRLDPFRLEALSPPAIVGNLGPHSSTKGR